MRISGRPLAEIVAGYSEEELGESSPGLYFATRAGRFALGLKREGDGCVFLRNNLCSIHEKKPAVCRIFPLKPAWSDTGIFTAPLLRYPGVNAFYDRGFTDFGDVENIFTRYTEEFRLHGEWIANLNNGPQLFGNMSEVISWIDEAITNVWGDDTMVIE